MQQLLDARPLVELLAASAAALAAYAACAWPLGLNAEDRAKAVGYARLGLLAARAGIDRGRELDQGARRRGRRILCAAGERCERN